jgi:DNA-binding beta-propeller fold protein YncE
VDENTNNVFVSCKKSNSIMVIDGLNNRIKQTIEVKSPDDLKFDKNSSKLYIKSKDQIYTIDIGTNPKLSITNSFSVRANGEMVLDPVRDLIYIYHKSYPSMDVIDANSGQLLKVIGTKEKSWGMSIDTVTNRMYVSNVGWLDNIIIDLSNGKSVGRLYLPADYPPASWMDHLNLRDYADWFNRKILVHENGKRVYIIYPFLQETTSSAVIDFTLGITDVTGLVGKLTGLNIPNISIRDFPFDWSTRHEQLAIYDSTSDELISSIFINGMAEMCLNPTNSKVYLHITPENKIYILDTQGKIMESITVTGQLNSEAISGDRNIKIHIEDIPFPLNNNSRYGFEINSKLNKIYLTIEGKSQDFLSIIDLNY